MLNKDLIDLINSGDALGIVGSGVSAQARVASWTALFLRVKDALADRIADSQLVEAECNAQDGDLPQAFEVLINSATRGDVHRLCVKTINENQSPGELHKFLADWPFRIIATTNYDHLLEKAAVRPLVAIGNRGSETRKVTANADGLVWHIHGSSRLTDEVSRLVVASSDYEEFYPDSNMATALKALAQVRRCIFVGFGFRDRDLLGLIHTVGRLSHAGRPSYAFLGYGADKEANRAHRARMLSDYNVQVIPYCVVDNDHSELIRLLSGYSSFVLRKSLAFNQTFRGTPEYDPTATSLRVQSAVDLNCGNTIQPDCRRRLVRARILASVRQSQHADAASITRALHANNGVLDEEIGLEIAELKKEGLLEGTATLRLTSMYGERMRDAEAAIDFERERFQFSLDRRIADTQHDVNAESRARVVRTVAAYFEEMCRTRGLGIAQNLVTNNEQQAAQRAVSLATDLHPFLADCASRQEALLAISMAMGTLTSPTGDERSYLGRLCQAYFGQHLVGGSHSLSQIDLRLVRHTCYLLDASVLLCLLAAGSKNHAFTLELVNSLRNVGSVLATTDLFLEEIVEHANWALRLVQEHGEDSQEILNAVRCIGDYRPNLFLGGYFLSERNEHSFQSYLSGLLNTRVAKQVDCEQVSCRLAELGISPLGFQEWRGFRQELFAVRTEVQDEIANRRMRRRTYRHSRQTKAEAEVALVVDRIRAKELQHPDGDSEYASFLSDTRVVDGIPNLSRRITMVPNGIAQWLWGCDFTSKRHSALLFEQLLSDLANDGKEFVNRQTLLRRFSGVIEAGRNEIDAAVRDRHDYLHEKFGSEPEAAFSDADPLDIPRFAAEANAELLARMAERVTAANRRADEAIALAAEATCKAKLRDDERRELLAHRARRKFRRAEHRRRQRSATSNPSKRSRRQKKRRRK